jgi:transposase
MAEKRSTKEQMESRVDQAELLLLQGLTNRQAQKVLAQKYDVSKRTATRYIAAAFKRWRENALEEDGRTTSERRKEHERMLKLITANAAKEGRLDLQLKAVGMLMQLYGTSVNTRLELTGKGGGAINVKEMSKNDIARLVSDAGLKPA